MKVDTVEQAYRNFEYALITNSNEDKYNNYSDVCMSRNIFTVDVCGENSTDIFDLRLSSEEDSFFKDGKLSLDIGNFSRQYRFWKENNSIRMWERRSEDLFHLNLRIVASLYICYKLSVEEVFIDSGTFKKLNKKFEERLVYQFLSTFLEESNIRLNFIGGVDISFPSKVQVLDSYSEILDLVDVDFDLINPLDYFKMAEKNLDVFDNENVLFDLESKKSCAVIGNSKSVLNKKFGPIIDNHDVIIRINNAPVDGFEENVGSRTDFRLVNKVLSQGQFLNKRKESEWINNVKNERLIFNLPKSSDRIEVTKRVVNKNEIYFLTEELSKEFENFKLDYGISKDLILSTGIQAIIFSSFFFDFIGLFGFDFYESGEFSHYWEDVSSDFPKNITHDWKREKDIVNSFSKRESFVVYD